MKKQTSDPKENEVHISLSEFLKSFNLHMPEGFPRVTIILLQKFRESHEGLFLKSGEFWSLDLHRKKLIDWLPRNMENT
jgi:hypothetical protein